MQKLLILRFIILRFVMISALVYLIIPLSFAQTWFGSTTKKTEGMQNAQTSFAPTNPVLSPENFNNKVNTLSKESKNNLTQELNQQLDTKQPPSTLPPPPAPELSTQNDANNAANAMPSVTPPASVQSRQAPAAASSYTAPVAPASSSVQTQQPAAQQGSSYTGFGTGNSNTTTNPSSSDSNGWNVKY